MQCSGLKKESVASGVRRIAGYLDIPFIMRQKVDQRQCTHVV